MMSNEERAQRGERITKLMAAVYDDEFSADLTDLLADLLHAGAIDTETLEGITRIAIDHYEDEVKSDETTQ